MCGLVGCAGLLGVAHEKALSQLLIIDQLRGTHSVGLLGVNYNKEWTLSHSTQNPASALQTAEFKDTMKGVNRLFIGHNRYATQGKVNVANAHPFHYGDIIGAHNGTLVSEALLPVKKHEVDSQNLYDSLNTAGSIEELSPRIEGAFALTWYDMKDEKLHICRNDERELFYTFTKDKKAVFWASEAIMLEFILGRIKPAIEHGPIEAFETKKEYILDPFITATETLEFETKPLVYAAPRSFTGNWWNKYYSSGDTSVKKQETPLVTTATGDSNNTSVLLLFSSLKARIQKAAEAYWTTNVHH